MVKKSGSYKLSDGIMSTADKDQIRLEEGGKKNERGNWGSPVEFILACIGYAVGLGNVWRFPYLCYKNGGGAFLIPYTISLLVAGLPIFYLELCLGQFSSFGPNSIFYRLAPITQGIGWGMVVVSLLVSLYYNVIIAWVLFYFFASLRKTVPWSNCRNEWNTDYCFSNLETKRCRLEQLCNDTKAVYFNKSCYATNQDTVSAGTCLSLTAEIKELIENYTKSRVGPAQEYFENYVLNMSDSFEEMGGLQWKLVLALLGAWIIVFLCLIKGVQSTGKVVYFTATFPYVILVILLIRGATLTGASEGVKFYIVPQFDKLLHITVWKDAAVQIFFSLGPAFGGLITMSSYNKFRNNCFRDAVLVAFTNCGTSVFAGFAIFSIAGFMANDLGKDVSEVVRDGTGLAFIAYPEAITRMPVAPLWAALFFFMLITLGLDSQFAMLETVTTAIMDQWPVLRKKKTLVVLAASIACFFIGLIFCYRNGIYVFTLFNDYSAGYCLIILALCEVLTVMYLYGQSSFLKDIQMMLGSQDFGGKIRQIIGPTGWYFRIAWIALSPLFLCPMSTLIQKTAEWCPAHERDKKKAQKTAWKMEISRPYIVHTVPMASLEDLDKPRYSSAVNSASSP